LDKLNRRGVQLQVCPIYTAGLDTPAGAGAAAGPGAGDGFNRAVRENADRVIAVRTQADLAAVVAGDQLG